MNPQRDVGAFGFDEPTERAEGGREAGTSTGVIRDVKQSKGPERRMTHVFTHLQTGKADVRVQ